MTGDPLDRRLDLDHLDEPLDLETLGDGHEAPYLSERAAAALERTGVTPWLRRHRRLVGSVAVLALVVAAAAAVWAATRPVPLADQPTVVVTPSGADSEQVRLGGPADLPTVSQAVQVTSAEPPDVAVSLVGLTGPTLVPDPRAQPVPVTTADEGHTLRAGARIDCSAQDSLGAALAATTGDFAVIVRRTSAAGETRDDPVPLRGATRLLGVVRQQCLQVQADRTLTVGPVDVTDLPAAVGLRLDVAVATAQGAWWFDRAVGPAGSAFVGLGAPVMATPDRPAHVLLELHPTDCGHPLADIADGIPVPAAPADALDSLGGTPPAIQLALPASATGTIEEHLARLCGIHAVTAVVPQVIVHGGSSDAAGGTLELSVTLTVPDGFYVDVADVTSDGGHVQPTQGHLQVTDGASRTTLTWTPPPCERLASTGVPPVSIAVAAVVGDRVVERPYLVALTGDELRVGVQRLCGDAVAEAVLPPRD
ncbi:MAG: hypothetical protein GC157_04110 [Frankiales bacterium]|nr:hypothetical protein [Frankiales bacterium]